MASKRKKRLTLRQRLLIGVMGLTAAGVVGSYALSAFGLDPVSEVTATLITVFGGAYVAYVTSDTFDHASANRRDVALNRQKEE